jgi:sortase (surface protein transpeptidase)
MAKLRFRINLMSKLFLAGAIILFVVGLGTAIYDFHANYINDKQAAARISAKSLEQPTKKDLIGYKVAPTLPRYLIIPKLGVDARILDVGLNPDGSLATPYNIYDTAWYNQSSMPGQQGAMLIDGHISSWTTNGVFYGLNTLQQGDLIDVQGGNGAVFSYKVVLTKVYGFNKVDMAAALSPIYPNKPGLNLISCTGNVIAGTNEFNERIVVFATQT